jgi:GMP synthase-like glutamine amidotransferase
MSVNDNNPHVEKVMSLLKKGYQENKKLKILGLCFGHQAVAKYFGGLV